MPVQLDNIDLEIAYILENWIQNNSHLISGTRGQNVVWNLAKFIKKNPENFQQAKVIPDTFINYTTDKDDCIVIFNNNSTGGLDWVDNRWNKYVFVNATDTERDLLNNKSYYGIDGIPSIVIPARTSVTIVKGMDDNWYEINAGGGGGTSGGKKPLKGVVGGGGTDDPIADSNVYESLRIKNLGFPDNQIRIIVAGINMVSWGFQATFSYEPIGRITFTNGYTLNLNDTFEVDLNQ